MANEIGSFSRGSTGNATILLNSAGTPTSIQIWMGARASTNETDVRCSRGAWDGTNQVAMSTFSGAANKGTRSSTSKAMLHYIDSSGATLKVEGTITGAAAGEFYVNMTTVDVNTPIYFDASF